MTIGVGHGKKAARHIDAWLRDSVPTSAPKHDTATFDKLNLWFFGDAARRQQPELEPHERLAGFGEVVGALSVAGGHVRVATVPVVRELLRVRRVPRGVPGGRRDQARTWPSLPVRLRQVHGLRGVLRAVPGPLNRDVPGATLMRTIDRRQRGGGLGRLPLQRGLLHLPDHAVLADGRAGRRVVRARAAERVGHRSGRGRDAERGRSVGRAPRRAAGRRAGDDVHRLSGPAADDPEHVQDRRGADRGRDARRRALAGGAGAVDLRRPLRRDGGAPDRLCPAGVRVGAGGPRPGARCARGDARRPGCRSCISSTDSAPRTS